MLWIVANDYAREAGITDSIQRNNLCRGWPMSTNLSPSPHQRGVEAQCEYSTQITRIIHTPTTTTSSS
ncbi:hypothetical protein CSW77_26180 [Shigella flexneri]|nr:hypothetical protein CSW77_26180 [Shigella flexneri]